MIQNYINHIAFVIDASGSMSGLENDVVKVFDGQIAHLAKRSKELDQETRVSVYLFENTTKCLIYDMDVMRLPSLKSHYHASGGTALIDATIKAVSDLELTPQIYADHAFLIYTMTDGGENQSKATKTALETKIAKLADNYTLAVLVPDQTGVHEAKKFGFPVDNIQIWNPDKAGIEEAGNRIKEATENFMLGRAKGIRGTKNLFKLDTSNLTKRAVTRSLDELKSKEYDILNVRKDSVIRDFVEDQLGGKYQLGKGFYQLTKKEDIQSYKEICVQDKKSGKVYAGANARAMLGLPNQDIKVQPGDHGEFDIFVQSTSVNRKLVGGTRLIVLK